MLSVPAESTGNSQGRAKGAIRLWGLDREVGAEWKVKGKTHLMFCAGQKSWGGVHIQN